MDDKFIVVTEDNKPKTGPLSIKAAESVQAGIPGAKIIAADDVSPVKSKGVDWGNFFSGLAIVGVLMLIIGVMLGFTIPSIGAAFVVVSPLYVALFALLRG